MSPLLYLYLLRIKGNVRNVFSKISSAIVAIAFILIYGGLFVWILLNPEILLANASVQNINMAIFIGIGFSAMMVGIMLLQKKKSLFMEDEAFYLFTGPFTRRQIMHYIMSQSILSSLLCGLISLFMMVVFSFKLMGFDVVFLLLSFVCHSLLYFFFTTLYYYVYLISVQNEKYTRVSTFIVGTFVIIILIIYGVVLVQCDFNWSASLFAFLNSDLFYMVPMFGWVKLIQVAYVTQEYMYLALGLCLLIGSGVIIIMLMSRYKANFVERAMLDAQEFSIKFKEAKSGKRTSLSDVKTRNIKGEFKVGAAAISSKNIFLMRKSKAFINKSDVIIITIYLLIAYLGNIGFVFFVYMLIMWLFSSIQNLDFMQDMNSYHIYLIPERPGKKLLHMLYPSFIKLVVTLGLATTVATLVFRNDMLESLQYFIMLVGYVALILSASTLSLRVLKSRNNQIMENMLQIGIVAVASIPSIVIIIVMMKSHALTLYSLTIMSWVTLLLNFVIAAIILYSCRNMMNGREIKSE